MTSAPTDRSCAARKLSNGWLRPSLAQCLCRLSTTSGAPRAARARTSAARAAPPKTSLRASLGLGLGLGLSLAVGLGLGLDVVARLDEATEPLEALPALAELH
eukprot:scaffold51999_cov72-Phaeocystis_antarctica.AAC.1